MVLASRHGQAFASVLGFVTDENKRVAQIYEHSETTGRKPTCMKRCWQLEILRATWSSGGRY